MLTEKDYCDYDTCVALRELGYVGICDAYYELTGNDSYNRDSFELLYTRDFIHPDDKDRVAAPSLYEAQKWLREKHDMYVHICRPHMKNGRYVWSNEVVFCGCGVSSRGFFLSYEEALSAGIKEAVEILKEK